MTNRTAQYEREGEELITLQALQAAAGAMARRGSIRKGGFNSWIGEVIERWDNSIPAQGEEFRSDESVREQRSLASQREWDWRVPYGMDSPAERELVGEIERRRQNGQSLEGLAWPLSADPYAPANDPSHPYYLPKRR